MLFDSHTHLNFKAFNADRDEVIGRCRDAAMSVMNVGAAFETSELGVELALQYDFCYASVGLHPIHVYDEEFDPVAYQKLIDRGNGRVRALGESGIDFWHIKRTDLPMEAIKRRQQDVFEQHIDLARKNDLALIIHGRNGKEDATAYQTIRNSAIAKSVRRAVVHCFGGTVEEAMAFQEMGFKIGFTGIVTFDKTGVLDEILKRLTMETILIETDAPYLTPMPYRGERNEPIYVQEVANHIARVKGMSVDEVVAATTANAKSLFKIE